MFPYREGWAGLSKDSYYSNDDAAAIPTKFAYLMYDWFKDRRASVTFMSPLNGDPKTSTDGRDTGKNWFQLQVPLKEYLRKEIPSSISLYLRIVNLNIGLRQIKML